MPLATDSNRHEQVLLLPSCCFFVQSRTKRYSVCSSQTVSLSVKEHAPSRGNQGVPAERETHNNAQCGASRQSWLYSSRVRPSASSARGRHPPWRVAAPHSWGVRGRATPPTTTSAMNGIVSSSPTSRRSSRCAATRSCASVRVAAGDETMAVTLVLSEQRSTRRAPR